MKSEKELRAHLKDLIADERLPCRCGSLDCFVDKRMIQENIELLRWILDENMEYEHIIERAAALAGGGTCKR